MLNVRKAKETLKILSKECENEMYVICNIFLKYMETKCEVKKKICLVALQCINDQF